MNNQHRPDEISLDQVERLLEDGKPSSDAWLNSIASLVPRADPSFQTELEQQLMAQLQSQNAKEKNNMQMVRTKHPIPTLSVSSLTWAMTILMVVMAGGLFFFLNQQQFPPLSTAGQVDTSVQIVIATQDIDAGTVITEEMVGLVSLSGTDMAEIRITQPGPEFFTDIALVIGQTAAVNIYWFQPIDSLLLGEPVDPCTLPGALCPDVPEGYYTLNFPANDTVQGLATGDRVDVLAFADGQFRVIAENILLAEAQPTTIVLAAPSWQHSILVWLYRSNQPYALRLHSGEPFEVTDTALVEYTFTAPEVIPDDYLFDLIVGMPVSQGYLLTDLPASIDAIPYTENSGVFQFWFKNIERVRVENGTEVTLRLPQTDAQNLDFLIDLGATLSFLPDEDTYNQP